MRWTPLGYDLADVTWLMRLFLIAAIPLVLSVPVQMSIGMNKIKVIGLAALARVALQPADQLFSDRPAGRGGSHLGYDFDDPVLEFSGAGDLRLPRPGD